MCFCDCCPDGLESLAWCFSIILHSYSYVSIDQVSSLLLGPFSPFNCLMSGSSVSSSVSWWDWLLDLSMSRSSLQYILQCNFQGTRLLRHHPIVRSQYLTPSTTLTLKVQPNPCDPYYFIFLWKTLTFLRPPLNLAWTSFSCIVDRDVDVF